MKKKNKNNFQASMVVIVGALAFILVILIIYKKKQVVPPAISPIVQLPMTQKDDGVVPLSEEKKAQLQAIRNITGKIISIKDANINVTVGNGEKLVLEIPEQGANFIKETVQADGSFLDEKIELTKIPKNKQIDIQYNSTTNEVMLIVVK